MYLRDLDAEPFSFDAFLRQPTFRSVDFETVARACVEAHARNYPASAVLVEAVKTLDTKVEQLEAQNRSIPARLDAVEKQR